MAKFNFSTAVAFATQSAEGTINATLDAITTTLTSAQGLILGHPASGVNKSGLTLGIGRVSDPKAFVGSSFTKPLSDFMRAEIPTFTFAFPFCGSRADAANPVVDDDLIPITGIDALLEGAYMTGAADPGATDAHVYTYGTTFPITALVYFYGNRLELIDCRCSLSIDFTPGAVPICTATVFVGSIADHSKPGYLVPAELTYSEQASVSAPTVVSVANAWQDTRGFSAMTVNINPNIEDVPDSNNVVGSVKDLSDRETTFEGTLFADDSVDEGYEYSQIIAAADGSLDALGWQVGTTTVASGPAKAFTIAASNPELVNYDIASLGQKAGADVSIVAREDVANTEFYLTFV